MTLGRWLCAIARAKNVSRLDDRLPISWIGLQKGSIMGAANSVVVRFRDGRMLKGTTRDFLPTKGMFHMNPAGSGEVVEVLVQDLKAVFFVKKLGGDPNYNECKDLPEQRVASLGKKICVVFDDGEILAGYTHSYSPSHPGFFVTPVDPKSNNIRVFVVQDSVTEVKLGAQAQAMVKGMGPR